MKKFDLNAGLFFGIWMGVFFILQNLFMADNYLTSTILKTIFFGLIEGVVAGILYGFFTGWFKSSKFVDKTTKFEPHLNENILFDTPANNLKGIEGVGGKLYLTNERLVFKSHKLNIQNNELEIQLSDVSKVDRNKTLGIFNNGLLITLKNDKTYKFVVERSTEWIKRLSL